MLYLNRNGQPEGPFSEQQLVEMIQRGQLTSGWVAYQGQDQWAPLTNIPALADALRTATAPGPGYTQPGGHPPSAAGGPAVGGYAAPPGANPYPQAAAAQSQGFAPAQPAHGYAQVNAAATQAAAKKSGSKLPLFLGLGLAAMLVVVGAAGFAVYAYLFKASGPRVAAVLPQTTQAYLEVPNLRAAALAVSKAQYIDRKDADDEQLLREQAQAMAESFAIEQSDALALALAQRSIGLGMANLKGDRPELAIVFQFDASGPVGTLLASKRFTQDGELGASGKRYTLSQNPSPAAKSEGLVGALRKAFDEARTDTKVQIGFWEDAGVLALATPEMLTSLSAVQDAGAPALDKLERFKQALETQPKDAVLLGWLDGKPVQEVMADKPEVKVSLADQGAVLSVSASEAGVITHLAATLVGADIAEFPLVFQPGELRYPGSLPSETFAYAAVSTKTALSGADIEREVVKLAAKKDAQSERKFAEGAKQWQEMTGVSVADTIGAMGDELVVGALAPADFKLAGFDEKQLAQGGAFLALRLKNPAVAEKLVAQLRDKILKRELGDQLTANGKGMVVATPLPGVKVEVRFVGDQLLVAGGAQPMVESALAALSGKGANLVQDTAHASVFQTLPKQAGQVVWVDTGRVGDVVLASNPALKETAKEAGVDLDEITMTGPKRVTSAMALTLSGDKTGWNVRLDTTNLAYALGLAGGVAASSLSGLSRGSALASTAPSGGLGPSPALTGSGSGGAACGQAVSCCEKLMARSGQPAAANCDAFKMAPAASCEQALVSYQRAMKAVGGTCD